ncbi:death-on-curing protein [Intrasporangium chromatireducens Q5-1]|uniref:Death-on-curing protein n=1 Tax=Intrasporangium chromatireducens Q5-1 TaxID=584657 RepID=W9GN78_9MICO|nr:type II toxin-antitoxin system death-on-curing family toxin [Intrasporangium chromatireducens]EWT06288.1 death-on-curing protein [Intrasporangium chromatireducens Q5-1]
MTTYLDVESLLILVRQLGVGPVRDIGLLSSALGRAQATVFGEDAYPTLPLKAAALLQSLAGNHALVDGNKRLALNATITFLVLNGYDPGLSQDEAYDLMLEVAAGLSDVEVVAGRLRVQPL